MASTYRKCPPRARSPLAAALPMLVLGVACLVGSGCQVVRDTGGIKAAEMERIRCAHRIRALREIYPPGSDELRQARLLYHDATAEINGWLRGVEMDFRAKEVLDVPESAFEEHRAPVEKFMSFGPSTRGLFAVEDLVTGTIEYFHKRNEVERKRAIAEVDSLLKELPWRRFGQIRVSDTKPRK